MTRNTPSPLTAQSTQALEWPSIAHWLQVNCWTPYGQSFWEAASPYTTAVKAQQAMQWVAMLSHRLQHHGDLLAEPLTEDLTPSVTRLRLGGLLTTASWGQWHATLNLWLGLLDTFFGHRSKAAPLPAPSLSQAPFPVGVAWDHLSWEMPHHSVLIALRDAIAQCVSPTGDLLDTAHPRLPALRQERQQIRQQLDNAWRRLQATPELAGSFEREQLLERDGRVMVVVRAHAKSQVPGLVHAGSGSGASFYIEPQAFVGLNNALQALWDETQAITEAILTQLTERAQPHAPLLEDFLEQLGWLDAWMAGGRLTRLLEAQAITVSDAPGVIALTGVRHPGLVLRDGRTAIVANTCAVNSPITTEPTNTVSTVLISGPNTGGKTVWLKTIGLCAWMARLGLPLPCDETSVISLFDPICCDIGDAQSIAENLSTFSAHIRSIETFLAPKNDLSRALVLLDELGAGTDPREGAALAQAIMSAFHARGATVFVTSHLGDLKLFAQAHDWIANASVLFDTERLVPTYQWVMGFPGASHGITVASKLGLDPTLIAMAEAALSESERDVASLLVSLEAQHRDMADRMTNTKRLEDAADDAYKKVALERAQLERQKRQVLQQFQHQLKGRIHALEEQLKPLQQQVARLHTHPEAIPAHHRERHLDKLSMRLKHLDRESTHLFRKQGEHVPERPARGQKALPALTFEALQVGELVDSKQLAFRGEITALNPLKQEVTLRIGALTVTVPFTDIVRPLPWEATRPQVPKSKQPSGSGGRSSARPKAEASDTALTARSGESLAECKLIGLHLAEAMTALEHGLDEALMANRSGIRIVHGLGKGVLKQAVRDYLKHSPLVRQFGPAQAVEGGDGVTLCYFH